MELVYYPKESLTKVATKIVTFDMDSASQLKSIASSMIEDMKRYKGVGLAANQVGLDVSLAVIDPSSDPYNEKRTPFAIVNPEIIKQTALVLCHNEGCLSIPGCSSHVKRFSSITVKYQDLDGNEVIEEASGKLAQIFQHEIDHLSGKLYIDRIGPMARTMVLNKIKKQQHRFDKMRPYAL